MDLTPKVRRYIDAHDLDETRRLLYGAMAASRTQRWELVGTLTNALAHHSGLVDEAPGYDLLDELIGVVETDPPTGSTTLAPEFREMRALIERLTEALDGRSGNAD